MTVVWQKYVRGKKYQVRRAGKTRRLYTNGVCHSEFNPDKLITGSIWDLLILPALFYCPQKIKRVLMLGVGGGACILQLHHLLLPDSITGVELDPVHLAIARRFFGIDVTTAQLHQSDASDWLQQYQGQAFDMIIDDLFTDERSQPVRAVEASSTWLALLLRHLSRQGQVVINFGSHEELIHSAWFQNRSIRKRLPTAFKLTSPLLENVVGVFMNTEVNSRILRDNINAHPVLGRALQSKQLRYRVRKMSEIK